MPRNQTVFISRKKLKKPQKTLAENSDVSVFQKRVTDRSASLARTWKHGGTEFTETTASNRRPPSRPSVPLWLCVSIPPPWQTNLAGKLFVMRPTLPIRKTSTTRTAQPGHFEFHRNSRKSRLKRYTMYSIRIHSILSSTTLGSSRPVSLQPNR